MRKMIIAVSLLTLLAGTANAAGNDTKDSNQLTEKSILSSTPAINNTINLILDENIRLRNEADLLQKKVDELSNKLDYTLMMHTSLNTLQTVVGQEVVEEINSKIAYMQMMHVTLMNLNQVLAESK